MSKISRTNLCIVCCLVLFWKMEKRSVHSMMMMMSKKMKKWSQQKTWLLSRDDLSWLNMTSWIMWGLIGFTVTLWCFLDTRSLTLRRPEERQEGTRVISWMYWATLISLLRRNATRDKAWLWSDVSVMAVLLRAEDIRTHLAQQMRDGQAIKRSNEGNKDVN